MINKKTAQKMQAAGVDPAVILALMFDDDEPEPAKTEESAPDPEPVKKQPEAAPEPDKNDAILAAIEKLTGAIQASNIRSMSAGDPAPAETADTILASLIAPPPK